MRVALLAAANSIHTVRWVNGLVGRGLEVHLVSAHAPAVGIDARVQLHRLGWRAPAAYLLAADELARLLRQIRPALLNAHYATGYGLLARRAAFTPLLLSVWGSDVYDFPRASPLHRWLLRGNLRAATAIASTSRCMARRTAETHPHPRVFITPFGVDEQRFVPVSPARATCRVVVGTVKTLAQAYGIDVLIDAFAIAVDRAPAGLDLQLEITGGGVEAQALQRRARARGVAQRVHFHGPVPHAEVPGSLHRLDIYAALSRAESFGVAAIEAAACGLPVLVSDADGFVEVTRDGETGIVVPRENAVAAAQAMLRLAGDAALRRAMGEAGRAHVLAHYTWDRSLECMIDAYRSVANR